MKIDVDVSGLEDGAAKISAALEELELAAARGQWAERLVELAAFAHVAYSKVCTGFTMVGSGRALCGNCEWQLSGRMDDAGEERSARFGLFVLGCFGDRIAYAIDVEARREDDEQ